MVVNELGSITDNNEYMLRLWVCNEGTMGSVVVRFPRFPNHESVEQKTAWAFHLLFCLSQCDNNPFWSHTFVAVEHEESLGFSDFLGKSMDSNCVTYNETTTNRRSSSTLLLFLQVQFILCIRHNNYSTVSLNASFVVLHSAQRPWLYMALASNVIYQRILEVLWWQYVLSNRNETPTNISKTAHEDMLSLTTR